MDSCQPSPMGMIAIRRSSALEFGDRAAQAIAAIVTYLTGEVGRQMVAGMAGGFLRWMGQEKRRLRDGAMAVISGGVAAVYLAPVVKGLLMVLSVDLGSGPEADRAAGFLAGVAGMSIAKVAIAAIETWARRHGRGGDNGQA